MATLATETFTGSNGAAWPTQWSGFTGNSGSATIQGNAGQLRCGTSAYNNGVREYINNVSSADLDITFDLAFATIAEQYLVVALRSGTPGSLTATPNGYNLQIYPGNGANSAGVNKVVSNSQTSLSGGDIALGAWSAGVAKRIRMQVVGTAIKVKTWDPANAEPGTWGWSYTDSAITGAGRVDIQYAPGNAGTNLTATFDNITVTDGVSNVFSGSAAMSGSGSMSFSATPAAKGAPAVTGTGTLSVQGGISYTAPLALSGTGTLNVGGTPNPKAAPALSGTGTLSVPGTPTAKGAPAMSGSGALAALGRPGFVRTAAMTGMGLLTAQGQKFYVGGALLGVIRIDRVYWGAIRIWRAYKDGKRTSL